MANFFLSSLYCSSDGDPWIIWECCCWWRYFMNNWKIHILICRIISHFKIEIRNGNKFVREMMKNVKTEMFVASYNDEIIIKCRKEWSVRNYIFDNNLRKADKRQSLISWQYFSFVMEIFVINENTIKCAWQHESYEIMIIACIWFWFCIRICIVLFR